MESVREDKGGAGGELYEVGRPRQRFLGGSRVIRLVVELGQLQDGHVAEGANFPDLQPFNETSVRKERERKKALRIVLALQLRQSPNFLHPSSQLGPIFYHLPCQTR